MEKRVLLAVVLSFIVLYGSQALFPPPQPQPKPAVPADTSTPGRDAAGSNTPAQVPAAELPEPAIPSAAPVVADNEERRVTFENASVAATFSTRGAVLTSWRLKKYQDASGQPLELVPTNVPAGATRPFTLAVEDPAVTSTLSKALFKPSATEVRVGSGPASLTFDYQDASGLSARKEFLFSPDAPYVIDFTATVSRGDSTFVPTIEWGAALGSGLAVESATMYGPPAQPIFYSDGSVSRISTGDVEANARKDGVFGFAGVDDHYFLTAALAPGQPLHLEYRRLSVPAVGVEDKTANFIEWSARYQGPPRNAKFFAGPKDFDMLAALDRDLTRSIHFGMFARPVVPLLRALKWVNEFVGNYGVSIIVLTVLINLAMFPLRHKSVVSMRRMQELQPEVKAIQERYAKLKVTDPARQKMNTEMMSLYRERGVNPASGCVPMLLTLPVLFAFYSMLSVAIELRGAPFVGWIRDLSVHDPLFITPVLMGLTQFVQTKMTPTTADPMQQKMMMFMPLIFMTMLLWAPSGLVLYWTTSNLWTIGQQAVTNRLIGPSTPRTVRPPAERRVKTVGGGKTDQAIKEQK